VKTYVEYIYGDTHTYTYTHVYIAFYFILKYGIDNSMFAVN